MSEKYQCTCPNGSYAIKHSTGCYEARIYELQAEVERLKLSREHDYCEYTALTDKCAGLEIERDRLKSWQESTAIYLGDADRALAVLFTMLTKVGLKEGAAVADETRAHVQAALKEVAHSKSIAQPLPEKQLPPAITVQTVIDEMGNCADLCERIADEKRGHTISYRAAAIRCRDEIHERMGAVRYSLSQKLSGEQS